MPVMKPENMAKAFEDAFNSGTPESVLELYEHGAILANASGPNAVGIAAIGQALQAFLSVKGKIRIESRFCAQTGDLALSSSQWTLRGTGPDGSAVEMKGTTAEVMRRQSDGRWLYVIDHPSIV